MNIFVTKLDSSTQSEDLRTLFEQFGSVSSAKVIIDRETGNSKCFGFVEINDETEGMNAINALNDTTFQGSLIVVKRSRDTQDDHRDNSNKREFHDNRDNRDNQENRGNRDNQENGNSHRIKKVLTKKIDRQDNNRPEKNSSRNFDHNTRPDFRPGTSNNTSPSKNSFDNDDSFEINDEEKSYDNNIDLGPSRLNKFIPDKKATKKGKNSEIRKKAKKYNKNSERKNFKTKLYSMTEDDDDF